ncbi:AraC family transcriptional regulator [Phyllobacterium sp. 21LDTY02-6]|uniref:helix-turn-helix domain-containing protein n=1 Tax=Phyllobacterium sp. 21LDTY02-6 TaxID=2944903 RepID=UPI0020209F68|nr:AraC family transcriptional regulator [Phyllobacterium sp. 21LDTY02-6]MCO4319446.1 AraC family transcriptional regulator [Phyllobacterium sp. 21LDTY02-6]
MSNSNVLKIADAIDTTIPPAPNPLQEAEDFIQANITKPLAISDIADAAELSVRSLQRLFRRRHASSPLQYLLAIRIAAARDIILRGEVSTVREIAAMLHFSNPGRFTRLYQRKYKEVPSADLRRVRHGNDQ